MTITGGSNLDQADIDRMVKEAEQHAAEDKARREDQEALNSGEALALQTEKFLKENDGGLPADTVATVQSDLDELKAALERRDAASAKRASEALAASSQKLGEALYTQDRPGAAEAPAADDDVVEAEIVD